LQALQPLKHIDYFSGLVKDFEAELDKPIRELSKGNRQKIGLLQAFMHEPEVLILDEPTSGLDPLMQEVFYDYVRGCRQRGGAVFLSSHNLGEVQHMCDRVGIIRAGKLIKELAVDDLGKVSTQRFTLTFDGAAPKALASVPEVTLLNINGPQAIVQVSKDLQPLLSYLSTKKLRRLASDQTTLEDEFMQFYEELGK
jgi:ABC-2 type transport system ATP-binding protein